MRKITLSGPYARLRARRWDAVFLGSALAGLVAAIRVAMGGLRVLVLEEKRAARWPAPLREPFLLAGACGGGILDAVLRALGVPLIERRRLAPSRLAYQVIAPAHPEYRVDVGDPAITAEELVAWELADPETARALARGLAEAGAAEREALLQAPLVRLGGLRAIARGVARPRPSRHARGLPSLAAHPPEPLRGWLEAQVRALAQSASPPAAPEARARLLAAPLEGTVRASPEAEGLRGILRRRLEALHGEVRTLDGEFELIELGDHPGVAPRSGGVAWLGRALVTNAPHRLLASWLERSGSALPAPRHAPGPARRVQRLCWRLPLGALPEAMADRLILRCEALEGGVFTVARHAHPQRATAARVVELVACAPAPTRGDASAWRQQAEAMEAVLRKLLPFAEDRLERVDLPPEPAWDDEGAREDPPPGAAWPGELELRLEARPPIYRLPREGVAALGTEGELLLGWRAGDALREALA